MAELRPIKRKAARPRKSYICMQVWLDNSMHMEIKSFLGRPVKRKDGWWIRMEKKGDWQNREDDRICNFEPTSDLGLDPHRKYDSFHRVFENTARNRRALRDLVRRQALREYLVLIGFKDPRKQLSELKKYKRIGAMIR